MAANVKVTKIPPKKLQPSNFLPLGSGVGVGVGVVTGRVVDWTVVGIVEFGEVVVKVVEVDDSVVAVVVFGLAVVVVWTLVVELSGLRVVVGVADVVVSFVVAEVVLLKKNKFYKQILTKPLRTNIYKYSHKSKNL